MFLKCKRSKSSIIYTSWRASTSFYDPQFFFISIHLLRCFLDLLPLSFFFFFCLPFFYRSRKHPTSLHQNKPFSIIILQLSSFSFSFFFPSLVLSSSFFLFCWTTISSNFFSLLFFFNINSFGGGICSVFISKRRVCSAG